MKYILVASYTLAQATGAVRLWHDAVTWAWSGVRFQGESRHDADWLSLPSLTQRGHPDELTRPPWSDSAKSRLESFTAAIPIPLGWRAPCLLHGVVHHVERPLLAHHFVSLRCNGSSAIVCTPMAIATALIALRRPTPNHRVGNEAIRTTQNRQVESERAVHRERNADESSTSVVRLQPLVPTARYALVARRTSLRPPR